MSVCSSASSMVSYNGSEMPVDQAIDEVYKAIQGHLNDSQSGLRQLAMLPEQNIDGIFQESVELSDRIIESIDGMVALFKELRSVTRQCVPKPNEQEKIWLKNHVEHRKIQKENAKNNKMEE